MPHNEQQLVGVRVVLPEDAGFWTAAERCSSSGKRAWCLCTEEPGCLLGKSPESKELIGRDSPEGVGAGDTGPGRSL